MLKSLPPRPGQGPREKPNYWRHTAKRLTAAGAACVRL